LLLETIICEFVYLEVQHIKF